MGHGPRPIKGGVRDRAKKFKVLVGPLVLQSGRSATNLGCIGNRVYTELADDELYLAFAGAQLESIVQKLAVIVNANSELEKFHRSRLS